MSPFYRLLATIAICSMFTTNIYSAEEMPVLFLDGRSHVELPKNLFDRMTQATIEVWVKWNRFNNWSRVFDFGREGNAVVLQNEKSSNTLNYRIWDISGKQHGTQAKKAVNTGVWYHIAVVSGFGGMEFYINGRLVDRDDFSGSLSEAAGGTNFIGKSNWPKDKMFEGYISELRIWSKIRSQAEIHSTMETALTGTEDGLFAYYRFTEATDNLIPNVVDPDSPARMIGSAKLEKVPAIAPRLVPGEIEKTALASYEKAKAALEAKQFAIAIDEFERLNSTYPKYKDSEDLLAQARQLEANRQAEDFYQEGMQYVQQGKFRQAYSKFKSALTQVPGFKDAHMQMQNVLEKAKYRVAVYPLKTSVLGTNITLLQQALATELVEGRPAFVEYVNQQMLNRLFSQRINFSAVDLNQTLMMAQEADIRVVVFGDLLTATATKSRPHREGKTAYTCLVDGNGKIVGRGRQQTYYIVSQNAQVNCEATYQILDTRGSILKSGTVRESLSDNVDYAQYYGDINKLASNVSKGLLGLWKVTWLTDSEPRFTARKDLKNTEEMMNEALSGLAEKMAQEINSFTSSYSPSSQ